MLVFLNFGDRPNSPVYKTLKFTLVNIIQLERSSIRLYLMCRMYFTLFSTLLLTLWVTFDIPYRPTVTL